MGLRFRKSIKIAPGVRLNLGKKSTSLSFGGKGVRHTISSTGRRTSTVGIPGTGLSYSHTHSTKKPAPKTSARQGGEMKKQKPPTICKKCGAELSPNAKVCRYCRAKVKKPVYKKWWVWLLVIALLGSCVGKEKEPAEQTTGFGGGTETVISDDTPIEQNEPEEVPLIVVPEDPEEVEEPEPIVEAPVEEAPPAVEEVPEVIPPEEEPPAQAEPVGTDYVMNTNTKKFHYTWCDSVDQMSEKNKAFHTGMRDELIASGYKACKNCNP